MAAMTGEAARILPRAWKNNGIETHIVILAALNAAKPLPHAAARQFSASDDGPEAGPMRWPAMPGEAEIS
jgi:hypothetical protein